MAVLRTLWKMYPLQFTQKTAVGGVAGGNGAFCFLHRL